MEKIFSILLVILSMTCSVNVSYADNGDESETPSSSEDTTNNENGGRLERDGNPKKHRMPSKLYIGYYYDGMGIQFTPFAEKSILMTEVTGMESGDYFSASLSEDNCYYLYTGILHGSYMISCVTEDGSVYSGIFNAD